MDTLHGLLVAMATCISILSDSIYCMVIVTDGCIITDNVSFSTFAACMVDGKLFSLNFMD